MTIRVSAIACLVVSLASSARAESGEPVANWAAPPYWSASSPSANSSERQGLVRMAQVPGGTPLPFVSLTPCRLLDTRAAYNFPSPFGVPPLSQGVTRDVPVTGSCGVPPTAQAVSVNFTVTNTLGTGFLVAWPAGSAIPQTSTLNYSASQTVGNNAVVGLGAGAITVAAGVSGTDLILDVNGYYAPQTVVNTVNGLSGALALAAGPNATITPAGNTLTIDSLGTISGVTAGTGLSGGGASGNVTLLIPPGGIAADRIGSGQVVKNVNGLTDGVNLAAGNNVSITPAGNTLTIASAGTLTGVTAGTGLSGGGTSGNVTLLIPPGGIAADRIGSGQVVKSLNGQTDAVTLVAGANVAITPTSPGVLSISASQPAIPIGRAENRGTQIIPSNTPVVVDPGSIVFANGGVVLDPVFHGLKVPTTGIYLVIGQIWWQGSPNAGVERALILYNSRARFPAIAADARQTPIVGVVQHVSAIAALQAGDTVYMEAFQDTPSAFGLQIGPLATAAVLSVAWLSP